LLTKPWANGAGEKNQNGPWRLSFPGVGGKEGTRRKAVAKPSQRAKKDREDEPACGEGVESPNRSSPRGKK